jgi:hypothetical protein
MQADRVAIEQNEKKLKKPRALWGKKCKKYR